jgi:DNA-binding NarL/FixJ family response regulator
VRNDGAKDGNEKLKVLVVDDHALFRRGLQMVLKAEGDIEVVGEAADGNEAVEKAQEAMPDVILMDVRMPHRSGIEATQQIKDLLPHVKILMLTISDEEADLYEAIKAGASGYLLKEISIDEVADAIRSVSAGQSRLSPSMAAKLLQEFAAMSKAPRSSPDRPGDGGPPPGGAGAQQPRHRQGAVHLGEHGQEPHPQHPGEAPSAFPDGSRGLRGPREAARDQVTRAAQAGFETADPIIETGIPPARR